MSDITGFQRWRREREQASETKVAVAEINDNEIREKAKGLGIKSWHIKSIETLKSEIAEKEGETE